MKINDIKLNTFYVYITQQNKDYFLFKDFKNEKLSVVCFNINTAKTTGFASQPNSIYLLIEKFEITIREFKNSFYPFAHEATIDDKRNLITSLFIFMVKI